MSPSRRGVFLDRDGVLVEPVMRNGEWSSARTLDEFRLIPGVKEAVRELAGAGFVLVVASNQPDIARRKLSGGALEQMNEALVRELGGENIIRRIYVCPHDRNDSCECRKPRPGLLARAAGEWDLDLRRSFFVGDREADAGAARAAGVPFIVLDAPYNREVAADYRARDLSEASQWILSCATS
ncbi:MAG: HAD-IIIA family hydrolase [Candidatus Omnitrophica bacterium]|nr:HAD-IIIA family hydrolase [Candidatus Omnitrophota bacterium]